MCPPSSSADRLGTMRDMSGRYGQSAAVRASVRQHYYQPRRSFYTRPAGAGAVLAALAAVAPGATAQVIEIPSGHRWHPSGKHDAVQHTTEVTLCFVVILVVLGRVFVRIFRQDGTELRG